MVRFSPTYALSLLRALLISGCAFAAAPLGAAPAFKPDDFTDEYCSNCHNEEDKKGGLDLTTFEYKPGETANFAEWVKIHDRLRAGEMPPKGKKRPDGAALDTFLSGLNSSLTQTEREATARDGRALQRRLNGYEYENSLRDLLSAPWLQIKALFPEDGEAYRFNKVGNALDVSHVHMARYLAAADYALREVLAAHFERPPTTTKRYYARDQLTLTSKFYPGGGNSSPDRMTFPVILREPQHDVRVGDAPPTVGDKDPVTRELEAVGWDASNYASGFTYRWDRFRAPAPGRYRVRFSGYTLWAGPDGDLGMSHRMPEAGDQPGVTPKRNHFVPNYDAILPGRRNEPVTVYTRNGIVNRRVGEFDLTPEPAVYDVGDVWLLANETLVPDPSRLYRSRPDQFRNPLAQDDGSPCVAFRWMEVDGPLTDESTDAGYRFLFGDLPLRQVEAGKPGMALQIVNRNPRPDPADALPPLPFNKKAAAEAKDAGDGKDSKAGKDGKSRNGRRLESNPGRRVEPLHEIMVEVVSTNPKKDADRLMRTFLARAYRGPVSEKDVRRFLALVEDRRQAGLSFAESMLAGYTAVLASPGYVFLDEKPGRLDDRALATRLALFLWNSLPDDELRVRAARGELHQSAVLEAETERMLTDPKSHRFIQGFLDYWIDLRKMEDSTPSTTLYTDYYLDDGLTEAALAETQCFFTDLVQHDGPVRNLVDSDYTFLNERLAIHYGVPGVKGIAMRRVVLPPDSPRGGIITQASVLKITANGTTTSPVLRGKWIVERILGIDIPPPPPVAAIEPDIRGAVTIRQQLDKHRSDPSCASCHRKMDPPGFALESFDVLGGWRDHYRGVDEKVPAEKGFGKNGHPFEFHFGAPVDSSGQLPDGRPFRDIREFKNLLRDDEPTLAHNLAKQLVIYATGAPVRFSDRPAIEKIVEGAKPSHYGVRSLIHQVVQSDLFLEK